MAEESMDEFLSRITAERNPLSDEEKKEAMVVAKQVWIKAMERVGNRERVSLLSLHKPSQPTTVKIDKKWHKSFEIASGVRELNKAVSDKNIDLVITLSRHKKTRKRGFVTTDISTYYFVPDEVIQVDDHLSPGQESDFDRIHSIGDNEEQGKELNILLRRLKEQGTREVFHPNKVDLQNLLTIVSSAEQTSR